ncbi:MAG: tetratricopeptide repeat protein [Alphaproteobacteria bacterium]|nr:tetratricopeptide repeat protein [Alphaproteobacteria bacterium]
MSKSDPSFAAAVQLYQSGQLAQAEALCRRILGSSPRHPDANNLLGVILLHLSRPQEAAVFLGAALKERPSNPDCLMAMGVAQAMQGQAEEALRHFEKLVRARPDHADAHYNRGLALSALGRHDEARQAFARTLSLSPRHPGALMGLGSCLARQGQFGKAVEAFASADRLSPGQPEILENLAQALLDAGQRAEAKAALGRVPEGAAQRPRCLFLQAQIAKGEGDAARALGLMDAAIERDPAFLQARIGRANLLQALNRSDEALACIDEALALDPGSFEAHLGKSAILLDLERPQLAEASARWLVTLQPEAAIGHHALGNACARQGRADVAEAAYLQALKFDPAFDISRISLGALLIGQRRFDAARQICEIALQMGRRHASIFCNLGLALYELERPDEAESACRMALEIDPDHIDALINLSLVLTSCGRPREAAAFCERAIALAPSTALAHGNLLMALGYDPEAGLGDMLAASKRFAACFARPDAARTGLGAFAGNRRLRIGYVSSDFNMHPVGFYLGKVLPFHDPARVELFCYDNSRAHDAQTERLRAHANHWRDITNLSDGEAARMIHGDGIDVLVDLSGHTANNRLPVFAHRPAPVQVSWMGYCATTGLEEMDYVLADATVVPEAEEAYFTEKVWRLPGCYLCVDPPPFDLDEGEPPMIANGFVTFGSFNNRAKICEGVIDLWAGILKAVPGSRLMLKYVRIDAPAVEAGLLSAFEARGVDKSRLTIEGRAQRQDFVAAYRKIDIALDTFPFGGGVTTAEALWMGVPTITLRSDRWSGRVSESFLRAAGMADLVAANADAYLEKAVALAGDVEALTSLRREARGRMLASPLCDGAAFTRKLEDAFLKMARGSGAD